MARIRVDILNTKSHNEQLQKTTDSLINELTSKDKLIEKYEMEIRQRNDQIEKKMHTVDRLNRKYEALVAGEPEEENLGPLEGTHKNKNIRQPPPFTNKLIRFPLSFCVLYLFFVAQLPSNTFKNKPNALIRKTVIWKEDGCAHKLN